MAQLINEAKRFQQLANIKESSISEAELNTLTSTPEKTVSTSTNIPSDVKNLNKAQALATTVKNRAKSINNIQEFPGAFEDWFKALGYQPGKITKSQIKTEVEKVLTKLGYK